MKNEGSEFKCPLCHSSLESKDYYQAIEDLKKKVLETYGEENKKAKLEFEQKLQQTAKAHEEELDGLEQKLQQEEKTHKGEIAEIKSSLEKKSQDIQKEKEASYKQQLADLKKFYDTMSKDNQKTFRDLEEQIKAQCKKDLAEKEKQLAEIKKEQTRLEKLAFDKGVANAETEMSKLQNDVKERDLQIERFRRDTEDLKKQLQQSQSELKGEVGEIDLYFNLTQAFQNDSFKREKRGTSMGDVVQYIRSSNTLLEMPIVYDNKQAESVTAKDIEKAQKYKQMHRTDYVIIVSRNLPKKDIKNGLYGEKEGVLLCHPCIVVDVARQIRRSIIEVSKQSESRKDRENKESRLYDYIRSSEFVSTVEKLHDIYQKAADLQDTEEKAHANLWKNRKKLQSQINDVYVEVSTGVDCIIQEKVPMQELVEETTEGKDVNRALEQPLVIKKKKKKMQ